MLLEDQKVFTVEFETEDQAEAATKLDGQELFSEHLN